MPPSPAAESASSTPGTSPTRAVVGGVSRSRAHKPLKQWKSGEEMLLSSLFLFLFFPFLVLFHEGASSFRF